MCTILCRFWDSMLFLLSTWRTLVNVTIWRLNYKSWRTKWAEDTWKIVYFNLVPVLFAIQGESCPAFQPVHQHAGYHGGISSAKWPHLLAIGWFHKTSRKVCPNISIWLVSSRLRFYYYYRQILIDRYNTDQTIFVFLLSTRAGECTCSFLIPEQKDVVFQ